MFFRKARKIQELQSLVNESRKALARAEDKITERNKFIKGQKEQIKDLKNRITDLETNIDYLFNNLSPRKKKLIRPGNQN